jgi:hypothetical protein
VRQAHRQNRLRELVDVLSFFVVLFLVVLFLSVDGIH